FFFFFFSSRRRHTRSYGDWSSDVCSSDLTKLSSPGARGRLSAAGAQSLPAPAARDHSGLTAPSNDCYTPGCAMRRRARSHPYKRSEERRVGKECRYRRRREYKKKKKKE